MIANDGGSVDLTHIDGDSFELSVQTDDGQAAIALSARELLVLQGKIQGSLQILKQSIGDEAFQALIGEG